MFVSVLLPYIKIQFLLFVRCMLELVIPKEGEEESVTY
jgi:hypothetical protein